MIDKYVGQLINIIYVDRHGRITQRRITVYSVGGGQVRAYDHTRQGMRTFHVEGILAQEPVNSYAS
ncbi:hypothetical protein H7B90_00605 [Cohnella xylanilytica]|uniref:WYL domain-containing protein n=1 Tax=Cohnella xylanilytica TaxID=557555 RepID=A0A841TV75_9BACL|nr:hypothetical protein [Cohnella xylanilytica]MBB6689891.1 hypothetical protein [Cohnella xylanilytica]